MTASIEHSGHEDLATAAERWQMGLPRYQVDLLTRCADEITALRAENAQEREDRHKAVEETREKLDAKIDEKVRVHADSCRQMRRREYAIIMLLCGGAGGATAVGALKILSALFG